MTSLEGLLPQPSDCIQDIIEGFLHKEALTLLSGPPYGGKTRLLTCLIHYACFGKEWFWGQRPPLRIAYFSERNQREIMTDFADMGLELPPPSQFRLFCVPNVCDSAYDELRSNPITRMDASISDFEPDVVILDTITHFLPKGSRANVNDYIGMVEGYTRLRRWAVQHHFSIIGVHHTSKEREGNGYAHTLDKTLGSQAIMGNTTSSWTLLPLYPDTQFEDGSVYKRMEIFTHHRVKPADIYFHIPVDAPYKVVLEHELPYPIQVESPGKELGSVETLIIESLPDNTEILRTDLVTTICVQSPIDKHNVHRAIRSLIGKRLITERTDDENNRFIRKYLLC